MRHPALVSALLLAVACSGGGGSSAGANTNTTGSVYVVVDTSTGTDSIVQYQLAGVALQYPDGTTTANLLAGPEMLTLADPSGEVDGFRLDRVPTGEYEALRLVFVPGSGAALRSDGSVVPAQTEIDVTVPIADGLQHSASSASWLAVGHNAAPPAASGDPLVWTPVMSARVDESEHEIAGLRVANVGTDGVATNVPCADDGVLRVEFAADCTFADDEDGSVSGRGDFVDGIASDDEIRVIGKVGRDGRCTARHARRARGNDGPRLIGRITELRPATQSFLMDVQAENRRGDRRFLQTRATVEVLTAGARIHRPDGRVALVFNDLQLGNLAKVKWTQRTPVAGGPDQLTARDVEVSAFGSPMRPEWEGRVQAVDVPGSTITVVPRNDDPIVIEGVSVPQATLQIDANTFLQRRERRGGGRFTIQLSDIVPGEDRIWWRGTVVGPTTIAATWVRVRQE